MDISSVILLGLVLWFVNWMGKLSGAGACRKALQENLYRLSAANLAAEEEAAQCRFACALFKGSLEMQKERLKEAQKFEAECTRLRIRCANLETELSKRRFLEYRATCIDEAHYG
ncbi:MAG: hypothetical protein WC736_15700 [Gallionella sp.]|jgi:hypothetical protein